MRDSIIPRQEAAGVPQCRPALGMTSDGRGKVRPKAVRALELLVIYYLLRLSKPCLFTSPALPEMTEELEVVLINAQALSVVVGCELSNGFLLLILRSFPAHVLHNRC